MIAAGEWCSPEVSKLPNDQPGLRLASRNGSAGPGGLNDRRWSQWRNARHSVVLADEPSGKALASTARGRRSCGPRRPDGTITVSQRHGPP